MPLKIFSVLFLLSSRPQLTHSSSSSVFFSFYTKNLLSLSRFSPFFFFKMLLRVSPAFSQLSNNGGVGDAHSLSSENYLRISPSFLRIPSAKNHSSGFSVSAAAESNSRPLTGVIFEPFEEVKKELSMVPTVPQASIARQKYADECEAAINEQINVEYNVSYVYHAMFAYFDRDNVALKGLAKFFKESSEEEREHAEKLMEYQNMRGGRVKLQSILMPLSEFDHEEKGDALHAMELALSLEKLTNEKLLNLHHVAEKNNDVQLQEFVEGGFLNEQVEAIKKISEYVAQLRRVGKGHGVWHFNQMLLREGDAAAA